MKNNGSKVQAAFVIIAACAVLMLFEGAIEIAQPAWWEDWADYHFLELLVTAGLLFAVVFLSFEVQAMRQAADSMEEKLSAASGSFNKLLEAHYEAWGLTASEREVVRFVLKGCSNAEIADIRNAAIGTVKAQTHSIYAKSGLSGKKQLMSFLLEELTDGGSLK